MTFKQDWDNLKDKNTELKIAKRNMKAFTENFVKGCSIGQYYENYIHTLSLERKFCNISDSKKMEDKAFELRSTSCFYKVPEPQYQLQKCANVRFDGTVLKGCCERCECRADIELFAYLVRQLKKAENNRNQATRKLLSNLVFWKQRNK